MQASITRRGWLRHVAAFSYHRFSPWALFATAFADSSFLPVPPDILLVPMALLRPERLRILLLICLIGSSLGAILGYIIGYGLWTFIGQPMVEFYHYQDQFAAFQQLVADWGVWIIIIKAFTPIPFKIAAIAAGIAHMNFLAFMVATVIGRALHFAMVGAALAICGPRFMAMVARYERPFAVASVVVVIGAVIILHFR
jgi:membrane protein YqaA with SNARE-associated domain